MATAEALFPVLARLPLMPAIAATCLVAAVAGGVAVRRGGGSRPSLSLPTRVRLRLWPGPGFIRGRLELRRCYGLPAARRIARRGRPSLSWRDRRLGPWQAYAGYVGRAQGWFFPPRVHTHFEQLRLVIAPPQKGKSAAAAGSIIDDPGPVVATSIRGDLIAASAGLRQRVGRVHVLNPERAGNYGSTLTWNPVYGCEDAATAARRAGYMVEGVTARGLDDASFWQDQASMTLAAYLHAAGLAGGSMRDVYRWILDDDPQPAHILSSHPGAAEFGAAMVRKYLALPDRTRAGISTTLNAALRFMQDPLIAEVLCPPGPGTLDIPAFLRSRDTLYLVVADAAQSPVPPVFTTLVAEIAFIARVSTAVAGRLDPPLSLELDEVANVAPIPVAAWATWAAGSGIRISIYVQSYSQLVSRWKEHGAETIWQSADQKIVYAHSSEDGLIRRVEQACGQVRVRQPGGAGGPAGAGRAYSWAPEPVLSAAQVRELPSGRALVIQGGARPVIVRTERYWRRRDVRKFTRRGGRPDLPAAPVPVVPAPDPALLEPVPGPENALGILESMLEGPEPSDLALGWPEDELAARRARRAGAGTWPDDVSGAPWPELYPLSPGVALPPGAAGWAAPEWPDWDGDTDTD